MKFIDPRANGISQDANALLILVFRPGESSAQVIHLLASLVPWTNVPAYKAALFLFPQIPGFIDVSVSEDPTW